MGNHKRIGLIFLVLFLGFSLYSYDYLETLPLTVASPRTLAMGGFHAADTADLSVIFSNPGAFNTVTTQFSFAELNLGLKGPINDIASLVANAITSGLSMDDLFAENSTLELLSGIYTGFSLSGPLALGYVGNGLALGLFNNTDVVIRQSAPLTLEMQLREDIFLYGGYSYRLSIPALADQTLDIGIGFKGGVRGITTITKTYTEIANLDFDGNTLFESPFDFISVIGFDIGALYSYKDIFSLGLTALDVFTPTTKKRYDNGIAGMFDGDSSSSSLNGVIPFTLNLGLSYSPQWKFLTGYVSDLTFLLDYKDILGFWIYPETYDNPFLHLSAGMEFRLLEILDLRMGLDRGLFSAGLGLKLGVVTLNVAVYGTEMGPEPGVQSVYNLMFGIQFRR